jgi:hypothetical protein
MNACCNFSIVGLLDLRKQNTNSFSAQAAYCVVDLTPDDVIEGMIGRRDSE